MAQPFGCKVMTMPLAERSSRSISPIPDRNLARDYRGEARNPAIDERGRQQVSGPLFKGRHEPTVRF